MATVATSSASSRVFDVAELTENILYFVDPIDLFRLQRVNKSFRDIIRGFKRLRQRMCLEKPDVADDPCYLANIGRLLTSKGLTRATYPIIFRTRTRPSLGSRIDLDVAADFQSRYKSRTTTKAPEVPTQDPHTGTWRSVIFPDPGVNWFLSMMYWGIVSWVRSERSDYVTAGEMVDSCMEKMVSCCGRQKKSPHGDGFTQS